MTLLDEILDELTMRGASSPAVMERVRYFKRAEDLAAQAVNFRPDRDRLAGRVAELEAELSHECLTSAHHYADLVAIVQLCGGDVEDGDSARECVERVLARAKAPHVRDPRRLKLRDGWKRHPYEVEDGWVTLWRNLDSQHVALCEYSPGLFVAFHADGSETDHATRLEAHDALIASGSESPFVVVVGVVAKVEGGAS